MQRTVSQRPETPLLVASGISKTFDQTRALVGADFELTEGEIHGLVGANGAGKSTLSKVITGHYMPDSGEVVYCGNKLQLRGTRDALRVGITIVMQETSLVPDLTVLENIFLPELGKPNFLNYRALKVRGREILESLGQADSLHLDQTVHRLSSAQKQLVEISKALGVGAKLIIFDEPTASLSPSEVERLFDIMERLRASNHGIIFVSHRLEEVFSITDCVTVMREGRTVTNRRPTAELTQAELIRAMVGKELGTVYIDRHNNAGGDADTDSGHGTSTTEDEPSMLTVRHLSAWPVVKDVSFSVRGGEVLGLGGLVGAGRTETVEAIFGLRTRTGGEVFLKGKPLKKNNPQGAIRAGVGFVAEDRRTQNIIPHFSVQENLLLAHLGAHHGFFRAYQSGKRTAEQLARRLELPIERLADSSMLDFSGGMQQKIIIARWLAIKPDVLILDEPTKGVDIGTRASIYAMLRDIVNDGVAIIVVSSDFEELLGICDRIVVMSDGRTMADLPSTMLNQEKLTLLAAPRASMAHNTELLEALTREFDGAGFWVLIEGDRLICLNSVVKNASFDPGFGPGETRELAETLVPEALRRREPVFVGERDGSRTTLLVPMLSTRGHDLGWVGLSLSPRVDLPSPESIQARIETG